MAFKFDRFINLEEAYLNFSMGGATPENAERMKAYIRGLLEKQREACAEACENYTQPPGIYMSSEMARGTYAGDVRRTPLVEIV